MKKRNLITIIAIAAATFISIGILFIQINIFLLEAINKDILAEKIIKNVFELDIIINNYDIFHKERSYQQFKLKHEKLLTIFNIARKKHPVESKIFEKMIKSQLSIESLMNKMNNLLTKYDRYSLQHNIINELYAGQMTVHSQNIVSKAFFITNKYQRQIHNLRYKANWYIAFLIIIITAGIGITLFLFFQIVEKKHSEEILKMANDQLELKVKGRTEELEKIIIEKETLVKEIHHRVKNNLGIIQSLLSLQSIDAGKEAKNLLSVSEDRVKSMSLIHEMLYKSTDLKSLNFSQYVYSLSTILLQNYRINSDKIKLDLDIDDLELDINIVIPLGLILNETITNSFKYAFPNKGEGEIHISLKKISDNKITLIIKDNGIGLTDDIDISQCKTLGLKLINILVNQIDAELKLETSKGTKFTIIFEDKKY